MNKLDYTKSKFTAKKEEMEECPYYGNQDDAPVPHCSINNCKKMKFCEAKTIEKLNVLTGKTEGLNNFESNI